MKKKLSLFIIMLSLLLLVGCFAVEEVKSVTFTKAPEAEYGLGVDVDASQFTVQIVTSEKTHYFDLTNANITVQGLVNGKLDTSTPGTKSVTVTYKGVSATVYYIVTGTPVVVKWTDAVEIPTISESNVQVSKAEQLAYISKNSSEFVDKNIELTANIDLSGKLWVPIPTFGGTFDGQGFTISNMTTENLSGSVGLFKELTGGTVKNLTFENPVVGAYGNKETAVLSGTKTKGADLLIDNVTIINANVKGLSCVAGFIGRIKEEGGNVTISNSYVQGRFLTNNPVLSTFGDGEGDKVGALVGQNNSYSVEGLVVTGNTVNVIIEGTRDLGGLVGWTRAAQIDNNIVLAGTEVKANVAGGVRYEVGTRNVGALVGTVAPSHGDISFSGNTVAQSIVLFVDEVYEPYSSSGLVFGGVRREIKFGGNVVKLNNVTLAGLAQLNTYKDVSTKTNTERLADLQTFYTQQALYMDQVSEILAG